MPELAERIVLARGKAYEATQSVASRVLPLLAADGRGGARAAARQLAVRRAVLVVRADEWLPGGLPELRAGRGAGGAGPGLAVAFGPAPVTDLKWWSGWTLGQTRAALAAVGAVEVDLDGTPGVALADDLAPVPAPAPYAALLPVLDPTTMGWQDRGWYLGPHGKALFDTNGNAGPTVWWDGRIVGGWAQRKSGEVVLRFLEDAGSDAVAAAEEQAARLQEWLGPAGSRPGSARRWSGSWWHEPAAGRRCRPEYAGGRAGRAVTRDPAEGVDAAGYLVTGAGLTNVPPAYRPVIADCVAALTAFPELDGLYLYGSVATGRARPPDSDLDLLALWTSPVDASATVAALSARHAAVVREVGPGRGGRGLAHRGGRPLLPQALLRAAGRPGPAGRPAALPAVPGLALGFAGDLPALLRSIVDRAPTQEVAARKVARRLLLGVATIESASHGSWTTDRATGAALLAEHHPQWTDVGRASGADVGRGTGRRRRPARPRRLAGPGPGIAA